MRNNASSTSNDMSCMRAGKFETVHKLETAVAALKKSFAKLQ